MNQKYIAPMIAGIFAIITTTLIIFQDEIKSLTSKGNIVTDLQGNWEAKWVYEDKSKMPTISRIKIEEQKDGKLYAIGFGSNDVENTEYLLEGWNTPTSISISYMSSPDSKKKNIVGTIILKKIPPELNVMKGEWIELSDKNDFYKRSVTLTPIK